MSGHLYELYGGRGRLPVTCVTRRSGRAGFARAERTVRASYGNSLHAYVSCLDAYGNSPPPKGLVVMLGMVPGLVLGDFSSRASTRER